VKYVRCLPIQGGISGSHLLSIEANDGETNVRYVLKRALGQLANVLRSACPKAGSIVNSADEAFQATQRRTLAIYGEQVRAALRWL